MGFRIIRILVLMFVLYSVGLPFANAQIGRSQKDSLKQVVKELRLDLFEADSAHDLAKGSTLRVELSRLLKPPESIKLLRQAADTIQLIGPPDQEIAIRTELAEQFSKTGKATLAYSEMQRIRDLLLARELEKGKLVDDQNANSRSRSTAIRDSLQLLLEEERSATAEYMIIAESESRKWQLIALATGLFWLVTTTLLFYRSGRSQRRSQLAIAELQAKVKALEERPDNVLRSPNEGATVASAKELSDPPKAAVDVVDPILVGMFRKQAPERITTLQAAREHGDIEKVVRVVHSLKPQLVAIDPERFGPLCATLTSPGSRLDEARWNASLDEFQLAVIRSIEALKG